ALGMPLLAAVVMLSNTQQSLADLRLLWVLLPGAALKPVLILLFHQSLVTVSLMSDLSIAVLLVALTGVYLNGERRPARAPAASGRISRGVVTAVASLR